MKCLITGISGFVGQYLARELTEKGAEVAGVERAPAMSSTGPWSVIECDILDFPSLLRVVTDFRPDQIYHLAGLTRPSESLRIPREYYLVNVQGTVNLLEAARQAAAGARCLLISSAEVYACSTCSRPVDETCQPVPSNPYGESKMLAEIVGRRYWRDFGSPIVIVRPFNHSGPGQSETFVVSDFCRQAVLLENRSQGGRTIQVGNVASARDFLDVRDVVAAYTGLAEKGLAGETYNIASGQATSVQTILDTVLRLAKVSIQVEVSAERYRPGTGQPLVGSSEKLQKLLGWKRRYSLEQTIADTMDFWRQRVNSDRS
jgi:GDP-4-dehydro-6-deoxy-D-mannose reductase